MRFTGATVLKGRERPDQLNSITISLAKKLADTEIKVTSICPGFVQTDLTPINREQAPLTAGQPPRPTLRGRERYQHRQRVVAEVECDNPGQQANEFGDLTFDRGRVARPDTRMRVQGWLGCKGTDALAESDEPPEIYMQAARALYWQRRPQASVSGRRSP
jgi:NAD(P)-dependent dehydrogenase (short-subunit alcohol dehydrogenase family)